MVRSTPADEPTVYSGILAARCGGAGSVAGAVDDYNYSSSNASPSSSPRGANALPPHRSSSSNNNNTRHVAASHRDEPAGGGGGILRASSFGNHHHHPPSSTSDYRTNASSGALECNFDADPTELYLSLQARRWDAAADRAHTHLAECATWISRYERVASTGGSTPNPKDGRSRTNTTKLRWRLLPLHAAVIFRAPSPVISALLCSYPLGAASPDDQGMLPLHLAFRNGSSPQTVKLLLVAYPNSVTVEDRKGRTPMVLARSSRSEHREEFVELLDRGAEYYAVAGASWTAGVNTGGGGSSGGNRSNNDKTNDNDSEAMAQLRQEYEARIVHLQQTHAAQMSHLHHQSNAELTAARSVASSHPSNTDLERRAQSLQDELDQRADDATVLVEHVSTLEEQLRASDERTHLLTEQIHALQVQLREVEAERAGQDCFLGQERDAALADNVRLKDRLREVEAELNTVRTNWMEQSVQHTRAVAEHDAERAEVDGALLGMEEELLQARADVAKMEDKMATHDVTEQSLVANVTNLARQLADVTEASQQVEGAYQRQIGELEHAKSNLQVEVDRLTYRMSSIGRTVDAMLTEQDRIVAAAMDHEATIHRGLDVQRQLVEDASAQTAKIDQARREREDIVAMLARHAEDIEQSYDQRRSMMEVVRKQEEEMRAATAKREELLVSVRMQKESLRALKESELGGGAAMISSIGGGDARPQTDFSRPTYARTPAPATVSMHQPVQRSLPPNPVASTSTAETDYKTELDRLKQQRDAAFARSKFDVNALAGASSAGSNTSSRGGVVQEKAVPPPAVCPLSPARPGVAAEVPLPMSPYVNTSFEPTHSPIHSQALHSPSPAAAPSVSQSDALEWAERALAQAWSASVEKPVDEPSPTPDTPAKADESSQALPHTPSLNCMSSEGGIKTSFSKPPLPPLPAAPTGDDMPYTLDGNFSEDQFVVESLTTEELIEEGQSALRQMPSLAGRDSPDTSGGNSSQDGSEDHSDLSRSGCLLKHATSLVNDDEGEDDHVPNEEGDVDADDESVLEREARELEGQLARIQSQGSTLYGVVSMESNSILATPSYMSEMMSKVGSRD